MHRLYIHINVHDSYNICYRNIITSRLLLNLNIIILFVYYLFGVVWSRTFFCHIRLYIVSNIVIRRIHILYLLVILRIRA